MIRLTVVHLKVDDDDEFRTWEQDVYLNPKYIIGFYALLKDEDDISSAMTRLWLDPKFCIKGFGVGPCPEVKQTCEEIDYLIAGGKL